MIVLNRQNKILLIIIVVLLVLNLNVYLMTESPSSSSTNDDLRAKHTATHHSSNAEPFSSSSSGTPNRNRTPPPPSASTGAQVGNQKVREQEKSQIGYKSKFSSGTAGDAAPTAGMNKQSPSSSSSSPRPPAIKSPTPTHVGEKPKQPENLIFVTYVNKAQPMFCDWARSMLQLQLGPVFILGWEPNGPNRAREYYLGNKIVEVRKLITTNEQVDVDDVVVFMDSLDSWVQCSATEFLDRFNEYHQDAIFSTEHDCWPPYLQGSYPAPPANSIYRFMNTGGYVGRVKTISEILEKAQEDRPVWRRHQVKRSENGDVVLEGEFPSSLPPVLRRNDQIILGELYTQHAVTGWSLDYQVKLFQSMQLAGSQRTAIQLNPDGYIVNSLANSRPCVIHWNGPSSDRVEHDGHDRIELVRKFTPLHQDLSAEMKQNFQQNFHFVDHDSHQSFHYDFDQICSSSE